MKLKEILSVINRQNLIEVVDRNYLQVFYGQVQEITSTDLKLFGSAQILAANCFEAEIQEGTFIPSLQIVIDVEL